MRVGHQGKALWLNRLIALISLTLSLICLYLAFTQLGERLFTSKLVEKLNAEGIESSWGNIEWSGSGICANLVRITAPEYQVFAEAERFCGELSLHKDWPYIGVEDLQIHRPKFWINSTLNSHPRVDHRLSGEAESQVKASWYVIQAQLNRLSAQLDKLATLGSKIPPLLKRLKEHKISVHKGQLLMDKRLINLKESSSRMVFDIDGKLSANGGSINLSSVHLKQSVEIELSPHELRARSPVFWSREGVDLKIERGASLTFRPQLIAQARVEVSQQALSVRIEYGGASHGDNSIMNPLKLTLIPIKQRSNQLKPGSLELLFKSHKQELLSFQSVFKELDLQHVLPLLEKVSPSLSSKLNLQAQRGIISGEMLIKRSGIEVDLIVREAEISTRPLATLKWPLIKAKGSLNNMNIAHHDSSKRIKPKDQWSSRAFLLGVHSKNGAKVEAELNATILFSGEGLSLRTPPTKSTLPDWLGKVEDLSLEMKVKQVSCQALFDAIPDQLLGPIQAADLTGQLSPELSFSYQVPQSITTSEKKDVAKLRIDNYKRKCKFESLTLKPSPSSKITRGRRLLNPTDVTWLNESFSFTVDPKHTEGASIKVGPELPTYVPYHELPSYVGGAMYLTEETGFWRGGAFSLSLLERAINTNLREGKFVYGGSTITQQLVKNVFLHRDKTLKRKLQEALISARVVDAVSKQRVLELYLNMIEFGPKIYGIQAAAQFYFQRDARALSPEEAVFLAMLKVAPHRGPKWVKRGSSPTFTWWRSRMAQIFDRLVKEGLLNERRARGAAPFILKWRDGEYQGSSPL